MEKIDVHVKSYNNIEAICCLDSVYSLLLYLLIAPASTEKTLFIFGRGVSPQIYKKLDNYIIINHPLFNRMSIYMHRVYYYFYFKSLFKKNGLESRPKYGHDFLRWTDYFVASRSPFYVLEDGVGNYTEPSKHYERYKNNSLVRILIDYLPMLHLPYGLSKNVKKVYLTGILETPQIIKDKIRLINIIELWSNKSEKEQKNILDIYSISQDIVEQLINSKRNILLLTQCYSENNTMTETEKIKLYRDMIKDYDEEKIIIKTHPREVTDYTLYFPSALVIQEPFPVQLLFFLGFKIDKVIARSSTALYSLPDSIEKIITNPVKINSN